MSTAGKPSLAMTSAKHKQLEDAGWTVGSTADFLRLTPEEQTTIDARMTSSTPPK
jgi:hypothetical protein